MLSQLKIYLFVTQKSFFYHLAFYYFCVRAHQNYFPRHYLSQIAATEKRLEKITKTTLDEKTNISIMEFLF
jgi:hypothetical protein